MKNADEAMTAVVALMDERVAEAREEELSTFKQIGNPTGDEIASFIAFRDEEWRRWRAEAVAKLRGWIAHDFAPMN